MEEYIILIILFYFFFISKFIHLFKTTEILPVDWNNDDEIYVINYSLAGKGYELKCLVAEDSLIINLMKKSTERTANITCKVKDHVTGLNKEYKRYY